MCEKRLVIDINDNLFDHYKHEEEISRLHQLRELAGAEADKLAIDKLIRLEDEALKKGATFTTLSENDITSVRSYPITPFLLLKGPKRKFFDYQLNGDGSDAAFTVPIDGGGVRVYWYKELYEVSYELYVIDKSRDSFLETCESVSSFLMSYNNMTVNHETIEVEEIPQIGQEQLPVDIDSDTDFLLAKGGIKLKYISQWKVSDAVETYAVDTVECNYQIFGDEYQDKTITTVIDQFT